MSVLKNIFKSIFCIYLLTGGQFLVYADELDDSIKKLKTNLSSFRANYSDYVVESLRERVKAQYLILLFDYFNSFSVLLQNQQDLLMRSRTLEEEWDLVVRNIKDSEILESAVQLQLIRSKFENEIVTLKMIRSDLKFLHTSLGKVCSGEYIKNIADLNNPEKIFIADWSSVFVPKDDGIHGVATIGNNQPSGKKETIGFQNGSNSPRYPLSAAAGAGASTVATIYGAGASAGPIGLAVSAVVLVGWSMIDSKNDTNKVNQQWDLVKEIREVQEAAVSKISKRTLNLILNECKSNFFEDFEIKVTAAIQLADSYVIQTEAAHSQITTDWEGLKSRFSSYIVDLERTYFNDLGNKILLTFDQVFKKFQIKNQNVMEFVRRDISPLVARLRMENDPKNRLISTHELWNDVIRGKALLEGNENSISDSSSNDVLNKIMKKMAESAVGDLNSND